MNKKIAFIESNTTGTGKLFIINALKKGYDVIFLTSQPTRYSFLADLMIVPIIIDTTNEEGITHYLRSLKNVVAVFSSSEYFIEMTAKVATLLNLPCNAVEAISHCRNKAILAEQLHKANIKTPVSCVAASLEQAASVLEKMDFPIVVKPVSGSGSVGVKRCNDYQQAKSHISDLLAVTTNERGVKCQTEVLIQNYIVGEEYSVEVIGTGHEYHLLGITKKYLGPEPFFIEIGHDFPAILPTPLQQKIENITIKALQSMGLKFGAAHIELRIHGNEVTIIEINPRLAGGMIPALIESATGVPVLEVLLDLYCGNAISIQKSKQDYAAIRFMIPHKPGVIKAIEIGEDLNNIPTISDFYISKHIGEWVSNFGDYRDRIGHIIAFSDNMPATVKQIEYALSCISIYIDADTSVNTGRLKKTLHPTAFAIVNQRLSQEVLLNELAHIIAIDEAHILMLMQQSIISTTAGTQLLHEIRQLKENQFKEYINLPVLRGAYLFYENILIQKLGIEVGGLVHIGRSRNDINATLFKLNTRNLFKETYEAMWQFRQTLLIQAELFKHLEMPLYSQFQPALPGNYGFYCLAVELAIARQQSQLKMQYEELACSPLGAGAGAGTSFSINPTYSARLLGFESTCPNALDAVANRDLALSLLSCLSILGTTLSRVAQDYQLWTTQEFGFFDLPDELTGGSSMLPQKKNPYLLEKIKGKAIYPTGQWVNAMATMQKTLYGNSVEVGTEALADFSKSFQSIKEALTLLQLIILNAKPNLYSINRSNRKGITMAACIAEALVKTGMSFRQAHHTVGEAISKALVENLNPIDAINSLLPNASFDTWSNTFNYGGGCSATSLQTQLLSARDRLQADGYWLKKIIAFWTESTMLRQQTIDKFLFS